MAAGGTVGALRVTLGASTANFEAGMRRAKAEAASSAGAIQKSLARIKGGFLGATAGLTATAVVSGLVELTKRGLEFAGSLGETAQQLGVTSSTLQVYRRAGEDAGATTEEIDKAIAKLTKTAGDAADGVKSAEDAFTRLGISVTDAQGNIKSTDKLLEEIADKLAVIPSPAERASIEVDLFGRAGQRLDPLLTQGSKGVAKVREEMEKLGVILSDEQIQKADETADKLHDLSLALDAKIAGTVADNADAILDLANALADLAGAAAGAAGAWLKFLKIIGGGSAGRGFVNQALGPLGIPMALVNTVSGLGRQGDDQGVTVPIKDVTDAADTRKRTQTARSSGGGGKNKADELKRKQEQELRRTADIQRDISDAKVDELQAQRDLTDDYVDRGELDKQIIDIEAQQRDAQLDLNVALAKIDGTYTQELQDSVDLLKASNERVRIAKRLAVVNDIELDRQHDFNETERTRYGIMIDLLQAESQLKETAAERRKIELEILDAKYEERRGILQRIIQESKDAEAVHRAQMELQALPAQQAADKAGVIQGTRGPLEQFQAGLPTTAAKLNEALQNVAIDGLQAVEDGLLSIIDGTKKVGEAFRDMATQIISDLLRIQIERALIGPLSNLLGGALGIGGAAGGAAVGSSSLGGGLVSLAAGFASGGFTGFMPRKQIAGVVHGNEFVFDADSTARIGLGNLEALRKGMPMPVSRGRGSPGHTYNINVVAPRTGNLRQDRQSDYQLAVAVREQISRTVR